MMKQFTLNGQRYELVTIAMDQSYQKLDRIAVYRTPNTQTYYTMPVAELSMRIRGQLIDLELYKRRFIGRTDIYAKRYFNQKGKKAYSPAGPFEKGNPSKTTHWPLTDVVLQKHLSSDTDFAIGIYPLMPDNTTKFLVFDIDAHHVNQQWQGVTDSLCKICRQYALEPLVEKSQSGKGCHIWLFFDDFISAKIARQLGDALIQATQSIDPRMSFDAFDRMFPAQDQLSNKQLGNLIAAPLEGRLISSDISVFVDENWHTYANQWQKLREIKTANIDQIQNIISRINSRAGFQLFESKKGESTDLFTQPEQINKTLTAIRANGLYFRKRDLTANERLELERMASFRNPEFYKRQANRMPVNLTPRIKRLFKLTDEYLILPRGLEESLHDVMPALKIDDRLYDGQTLHVEFNGDLRPNQLAPFAALKDKDSGILAARTGFGKTVIGARLICERAVSTLILVPNRTLAEQWCQSLKKFLDISDEPIVVEHAPSGRRKRKHKIGTYYGAKKNLSGLVDVATIQSISKLKDVDKFLSRYGMVISDEVHHDAAITFDSVISQVRSRYLYGLSATPYRRDGQEPILTLRFGPIRYQTNKIDPQFALTIKRKIIPRFTSFGMTNMEPLQNGITENRTALMNDAIRDEMIIRDIQTNLHEKRHIIVLTNLIAHVDQLLGQLTGTNVYRLYGSLSSKERRLEIERIQEDEKPYVILATTQTAGEGLDIPSLDTMILAMPIGYRGNVEQYIGRLHRGLSKKDELRVYDFVDMFIPMLLRMYRKRRIAYKELGYEIVEDEYSKLQSVRLLDGHYQKKLRSVMTNAQTLVIMVPRLKGFLIKLIKIAIENGCTVKLCTQAVSEVVLPDEVVLTQYEYNLPNCIIINDRQLWLSADESFESDRGMSIQLDQSELVKQVETMLLNTRSGLKLD